jgi:hypothetical protein
MGTPSNTGYPPRRDPSLPTFVDPTAVKVPLSTGFVKHDKEKPALSLIDPDFIFELAAVLTHGARKYTVGEVDGAENWKKCKTPWRTYGSALFRHCYDLARGRYVDPDSGESTVAHIACNVMFLSWFVRNGLLEAQLAGRSGAPADGKGNP